MMDALIYDGSLHLATVPKPALSGDQVLIKIRKAGICNTDLELTKGYMNFSGILGHEFVGEVVAGDSRWLGKRVVGEINVADGDCDFCRRGIPSQCRNRTTVGIDRHPGGFAEYLALTTCNLHVVPDHVSDEAAVFVEPLAAALQVLESTQISPHDRVIVIGAGKLGMLVAQVLKLTGANLSVVVRRERPAALLQKWAIHTTKSADPHSAQVVVDCTGTAGGFEEALKLIEPRGTIVLKSTYHNIPQVNLTQIVVDEIRVIGSRCGPFDAALRLLATRLVDVESLIDARYSLRDALKAMEFAAGNGVLKVLLEM